MQAVFKAAVLWVEMPPGDCIFLRLCRVLKYPQLYLKYIEVRYHGIEKFMTVS